MQPVSTACLSRLARSVHQLLSPSHRVEEKLSRCEVVVAGVAHETLGTGAVGFEVGDGSIHVTVLYATSFHRNLPLLLTTVLFNGASYLLLHQSTRLKNTSNGGLKRGDNVIKYCCCQYYLYYITTISSNNTTSVSYTSNNITNSTYSHPHNTALYFLI
jgi:hypothetical protein